MPRNAASAGPAMSGRIKLAMIRMSWPMNALECMPVATHNRIRRGSLISRTNARPTR